MVRMALAALALSGVCQRYRSMYHALSRVTSGGGAASPLAVAGRIAGTDTRRCEAFSGPWPPLSLCSTLRDTARPSRPRERVWRARTAPGIISSVSACPSSLCKECVPMSQTATLRTLIQSPDLLVMPGIFEGVSHLLHIAL